jgi:hypothetical protein
MLEVIMFFQFVHWCYFIQTQVQFLSAVRVDEYEMHVYCDSLWMDFCWVWHYAVRDIQYLVIC